MTIYRNQSYLEKSRFGEAFDLPAPEQELDFIFVIPYTTFHVVLESLRPFRHEIPGIKAEFLLPLNFRQKQSEVDQQKGIDMIRSFVEQSRFPYPIHLLQTFELPDKKDLRNMAFKIGMDEALNRFQQIENKNGWIISIDPGLQFPEGSLTAIKEAIEQKPKADAMGFGFSLGPDKIKLEISQRYLIEALRYAGHPHAGYVHGNTFAYRQTAYEKYGGIPQKKIGFSFSFIQKFIAQRRFKELPTLEIERKSLEPKPNFIQADELAAMELFVAIREFLDQLNKMFKNGTYEVKPVLKAFLDQEDFEEKLPEMRKHSNSVETFSKRFFAWFGLARAARFLGFGKDYFPVQAPVAACRELFGVLGVAHAELDEEECLRLLRSAM